jgi:hypothetical protein
MEDGDYGKFRTHNAQALERCEETTSCAVVLFNLGFVHAYPYSPYYDPVLALQYFQELTRKYPRTPWAFQGQVWGALLRQQRTMDEARRRLQADLRSKEATIRSLRERLNRSRDIDVQMDKKERELVR